MTTGATTYGSINQRTAAYAAKEILKHAEFEIVVGKMGSTKPCPKNQAEQVKFRRLIPFTVSTTPLQEGVTPTSDQMAQEYVSVTLRQYGRAVTVTDWVADVCEDPILNDATMLLGELAGGTVEQIIWNAIKGGTTVAYANGAARASVNTPISLNKQRAAVRTLRANKAKKITRVLSGSPDYSTYPVEAAYVAVAHTHLEHDIRGLPGFTPVAEYGSMKPICPEEVGACEDVRYILTADAPIFTDAGGAAGAMVSTTGTSADVYPIIIMGMEFFGQVPLKGAYSLKPFVINASHTDSDPLAQRNKVGFKFAYAALILNERWGDRLEVAATSL